MAFRRRNGDGPNAEDRSGMPEERRVPLFPAQHHIKGAIARAGGKLGTPVRAVSIDTFQYPGSPLSFRLETMRAEVRRSAGHAIFRN